MEFWFCDPVGGFLCVIYLFILSITYTKTRSACIDLLLPNVIIVLQICFPIYSVDIEQYNSTT